MIIKWRVSLINVVDFDDICCQILNWSNENSAYDIKCGQDNIVIIINEIKKLWSYESTFPVHGLAELVEDPGIIKYKTYVRKSKDQSTISMSGNQKIIVFMYNHIIKGPICLSGKPLKKCFWEEFSLYFICYDKRKGSREKKSIFTRSFFESSARLILFGDCSTATGILESLEIFSVKIINCDW